MSGLITRRDFLKGLITATALVAVPTIIAPSTKLIFDMGKNQRFFGLDPATPGGDVAVAMKINPEWENAEYEMIWITPASKKTGWDEGFNLAPIRFFGEKDPMNPRFKASKNKNGLLELERVDPFIEVKI